MKLVSRRPVQEAPKICEAPRALLIGYGRSLHVDNRSGEKPNSTNGTPPLLRNVAIST